MLKTQWLRFAVFILLILCSPSNAFSFNKSIGRVNTPNNEQSKSFDLRKTTIGESASIFTSLFRKRNEKKKTGKATDDDWENWEDGEKEDDSFGNIFNTINIYFENAQAGIINENDRTILRFTLEIKTEDEEAAFYRKNVVATATAFFTFDDGIIWNQVTLRKFFDSSIPSSEETEEKSWFENIRTTFINKRASYEYNYNVMYDLWTADVEITQDHLNSPIIYFFRAEAPNGNVTTEVPLTSPGWPPAPGVFFPGINDTNNPDSLVPPSLDILNSYLAYDGNYLYIAIKTEGPVSPGNIDSSNINLYDIKFTNPKVHKGEGLMTGLHQIYSPLSLFPYKIFDVEDAFIESIGRAADFCVTYAPYDPQLDTRMGYIDDFLFYRAPLKTLCPDGCDTLRTINITVMNSSLDSFMPIPMNASPFLLIYLRAHAIGGEPVTDLSSGTVSTSTFPDADTMIPDDDGWEQWPPDINKMNLLKEEHEARLQNQFGINARDISPIQKTEIFHGKGPFRISPCDIIYFEDFYLEAYTRNNRLKLRIFKNNEYIHTIMISYDTRSRRDEQHQVGDHLITLSDFNRDQLSAVVEIK